MNDDIAFQADAAIKTGFAYTCKRCDVDGTSPYWPPRSVCWYCEKSDKLSVRGGRWDGTTSVYYYYAPPTDESNTGPLA